jgi:TP901 family phage tail tape measure protein
MSVNVGDVVVRLGADTAGFQDGMVKARGELAATGAEAKGGFSSAMAGAAIGLVGVGIAGAAVIAGTVLLASTYTKATDEMAAQSNISAASAKVIGDAFLTTGGQTTYSADQMMKAFGPVSGQLATTEGHALSAADAMTVMSAGMALAESTGTSLDSATADLAKVMQTYKLGVGDAAHVTDVLYNSSRMVGQPVDSITTAIDKLHGKLGEVTPSLGDTAGLMVTLAANGVPARLAVSAMSATFIAMLDPTASAAAAMKEVGLTTLTSKGQFVGMDSVIAQLNPKFEKMTAAQRLDTAAKIFGKPAAEAMVGIVMGGTKAYDAQTAAIGKNGSAQAGAQTATDNLAGSFDKIRGSLTDAAIKAGEFFMPFVDAASSSVASFISDVAKDLQNVSDSASNADGPARAFALGIRDVGTFIGTEVIPRLQEFAGFVGDTVIPDLIKFGGFVEDNIVPPLESLGATVVNVGTWIATNLIPPMVTIGGALGTGLADVFGFLSQNMWLVEAAAGALLLRFVAIKTLAFASEVLAWSGALRTFAMQEGGVSAVAAALGLGGSGGLRGAISGASADAAAAS